LEFELILFICFHKSATAMKSFLLFFWSLFSYYHHNAQGNPTEYTFWVERGDSLYAAGQYNESAAAYCRGFKAMDYQADHTDRYNAACSYALAGIPDSSFKHLINLCNESDYLRTDFMCSDKDLVVLHKDNRWRKLVKDVKKSEKERSKNHDKKLIDELSIIYEEDQKYRQMIDSVQGNFGRGSAQMDSLWKTIVYVDSVNLVKVKKILDKKGWLGPDVITKRGSTTLFLVIQHSDLHTQEKYLPLMEEAVKNKKAEPSNLALLQDRVLIGQEKKQLYGSQIGFNKEKARYYVLPLEDPMNVDVRRKEMNLEPLADYVATWGISWDPALYLKEIEELKEK
jgi:hypothetical protein